jgi:hypothetical protein
MIEIDIAELVKGMREQIKAKGKEGGPWYFYSGYDNRQPFLTSIRRDLSLKLNLGFDDNMNQQLIPSMEDIKAPKSNDNPISQVYEDSVAYGGYFWAAHSKAYSQAISGKVHVVIPKDMPINMPYDSAKGSNWWSFEASELTRNPDIEEIQLTRVSKDPSAEWDSTLTPYPLEGSVTIWKKGDEPFGFPGDEHYELTRPAAPFDL